MCVCVCVCVVVVVVVIVVCVCVLFFVCCCCFRGRGTLIGVFRFASLVKKTTTDVNFLGAVSTDIICIAVHASAADGADLTCSR